MIIYIIVNLRKYFMKLHIRLLIALTLLTGRHHAVAQSFVLSSTNAVGNWPICIIAADVNGNGEVDLICANASDNTLLVVTNDGSGSFGSNATLNVGNGPVSVAAADVNGDGKVDLICANTYDNTLSVLTNNGCGNFGSNATLNVGNVPASVTAADVNGDGRLDLICANCRIDGTGNTLSVLTNNGGGFVLASTLTVGTGAYRVIATDVNGDGKVDLISANQMASTLSVLTNDGNGGFALASLPSVPMGPVTIVAADINGDGKVDLISGNANSYNILVLTNDGIGSFALSSTLNTIKSPISIATADVNGDGTLDLIYANYGDTTLTVLTNDGSGSFAHASTLVVGSYTKCVIAADVNGDGRLDLIGTYAYAGAFERNNTLAVLINTSVFPPPTSTPSLALKRSGTGMIVSWPSASAGWSLQQNPDLATMNWSPSGYNGYGISDDGTNKSLIIRPPTGNLFFRLLHP